MGHYGGSLNQDLIGEKGFHRSRVLNYGSDSWERDPSRLRSSIHRDHAASGRHDRSSRSYGEILEEVANAVNPAQARGRGTELGKEKSRWNSSEQVTRTHSRTDRGRDVILEDEVTLPGPSFIQNLARNNSPHRATKNELLHHKKMKVIEITSLALDREGFRCKHTER